MTTDQTYLMKVSGRSNPQSVAAKLANNVYRNQPVMLRMIGAGAVNQAVKALAIAQSMANKEPNHLALLYRFKFETVSFDEVERSALVAYVYAVDNDELGTLWGYDAERTEPSRE